MYFTPLDEISKYAMFKVDHESQDLLFSTDVTIIYRLMDTFHAQRERGGGGGGGDGRGGGRKVGLWFEA